MILGWWRDQIQDLEVLSGSDSMPMNEPKHYEILETIGEGHFAKVKLAWHALTKRLVAIKVIQKTNQSLSSVKEQFREADSLRTVNHPNIVNLLEVIDTEETLFILQSDSSSSCDTRGTSLTHDACSTRDSTGTHDTSSTCDTQGFHVTSHTSDTNITCDTLSTWDNPAAYNTDGTNGTRDSCHIRVTRDTCLTHETSGDHSTHDTQVTNVTRGTRGARDTDGTHGNCDTRDQGHHDTSVTHGPVSPTALTEPTAHKTTTAPVTPAARLYS
ncbi:hypothetical protein JEQ12_019224 [Ovis aries]|uniref:non-specific serine/threonine protein kinase n=1 Tax=Ovis aries TaxID=9940 RepID=A0A836D0C4_SHEEP|nr:hypothetical protein JEQ12_019224 [Ovis aries]